MIKANDITKALIEAFDNDSGFNGFTLERSEYVNENPSLCPWLGVYRAGMDYQPETLGLGEDHWTGLFTVNIVVQAANMASGEESEDDLESYVELVISKVFADTSIGAIVDMVNSVKVTYSYKAEDETSMYFQSAIIEMIMEVSTS